jgi:hypothetical protein
MHRCGGGGRVCSFVRWIVVHELGSSSAPLPRWCCFRPPTLSRRPEIGRKNQTTTPNSAPGSTHSNSNPAVGSLFFSSQLGGGYQTVSVATCLFLSSFFFFLRSTSFFVSSQGVAPIPLRSLLRPTVARGTIPSPPPTQPTPVAERQRDREHSSPIHRHTTRRSLCPWCDGRSVAASSDGTPAAPA